MKLFIKKWLGITDIERRLDRIEDVTGIGYVYFSRYTEYRGEKGRWVERLKNIEKKLSDSLKDKK